MASTVPSSILTGVNFPAFPAHELSRFLTLQFQLSQSQWWSLEELRAAQWLQLQPLISYAALHSPYYRDLFARNHLTPPAGRDDVFFAKIPVSTRADLQAAGTKLNCHPMPTHHGRVADVRTSGSTGQPLSFQRTEVCQDIWSSLAMREYFWQKRDFSKRLGSIRIFPGAFGKWPEGSQSESWGGALGALYPTGPSFALCVTATPAQQIEWLMRTKPDYLTSFPSNLRALANYARQANCPLPKVVELRTIGELLTPENRDFISEVWQAPVTDMYTCEEAGYLALQCPDHPGYHVQSEHVILEVLDDHGQPCAPGQTGKVVVTDLHNFATPFIRYEIGDLAEVGTPCPCGRGLLRITRILGRVRNQLHMPDGTKVFPRLGERHIAATPEADIRQYRIVQRSLTRLKFQYVAPNSLNEAQQAHITKGLRGSLGYPFEIVFSPVETIPIGINGKLEVFVSEVL